MRLGTGAGLKVLAPSASLLRAFMARKRTLVKAGIHADEAHAEASRLSNYRDRFRKEIVSKPSAVKALREVIAESKTGDLYLMCMCPYKTRGEACHTYHLLELARELDPSVRLLPEPAPKRPGRRT